MLHVIFKTEPMSHFVFIKLEIYLFIYLSINLLFVYASALE